MCRLSSTLNDIEIRDVLESDLNSLRELNEANVPHVNSLTVDELRRLWQLSTYFRVVEEKDELLACLLVLSPGREYKSLNYQWFSSRYQEFLYIDRVMVASSGRRRGLASMLYEDLFDFGRKQGVPRVLCEYNLRPANNISRDFHTAHAFQEVGQQDTEAGSKRVSLQCRSLD